MAKYLKFSIFVCLMAKVKANQVYILSTAVYFNDIYVQDHRLDILPGNKSMNIVYNMAKDQPLEPWWKIDVDTRNRRTKRYRNLFRTIPINLCHMMKSLNHNFYMAFMNEFLKRGGVPNKCPYKKANFTWLGISAANMNIPQFFAGVYRTQIINYFQRDGEMDLIANDTIDWEVK